LKASAIIFFMHKWLQFETKWIFSSVLSAKTFLK
jgi:hypothetical protein